MDFAAIKEKFDLLELVERDLGPGKKSSRWWLFSCPFPGHKHGDQNPSLTVTPDNGRYYCFTCGKSGDSITWLLEYRGMTWKEIKQLAGADPGSLPAKPRAIQSTAQPALSGPPGATWQERGLDFIAECEEALWEPGGERALSWLHEKRGLTNETIRRYRLGYNPADKRSRRDDWGLVVDPDSKPIWMPRGIVIPWLIAGALWAVNIRRPIGKPKYYKIPGSCAALFGADYLAGAEIILLTEGEFDCMIANQKIGDVAGIATLGSASKGLNLGIWGVYLLPALFILAAYDLDIAGKAGLEKLAGKSERIHAARVPALRPGDKDLTDYYLAGGDLWEWLKYQLESLGYLAHNHNQPIGGL